MRRYGQGFYVRFLVGREDTEDFRRRELILNALLCGLTVAGLIGLIAATLFDHFGDSSYRGNTIPDIALATATNLILWRLARSRYHTAAAYIFLACIGAAAGYLALTWSFELPTVTLISAILIMVAGMILNQRATLLITAGLVALLLLIGHSQVIGLLHPHTDWLGQPLQHVDCLDYALLISLVGLVSWLANSEIDRSLERAHQAQVALRHERDTLEQRVIARTTQLEQAQRLRIRELQYFAEFGRLNVRLLHELANPLTAAALHLELYDKQPPVAVQEVKKNLEQMEGYVRAAHRQLQAVEEPQVALSVV